MDILSILRILKSRLWLLIAFPLVSVIVAVFLLSKMDRSYKSTAQISTGYTSDEAVTLGDDKTNNQFEVTTKFSNTIETMKSLPVMSLISYRLMLHDLDSAPAFRQLKPGDQRDFVLDETTKANVRYLLNQKLKNFETLNSFLPEDKLAHSLLEAYKYDEETLQKKSSIYRKSTSDFITIEFLSESPILSAYVVNTYCQEFLRYNKTLKTDRSSESIDFLEKMLIEKRTLRDEKTKLLSDYKVANNVVNYGAESESKIQQITTYEVNKEIEDKKINGLILAISTVKDKIATYHTVDKSEITKVNQRIIELRGRITQLSESSNEADRAKVTQLREELQLEISRLDLVNKASNQEELDALIKEREKFELELQIARSNFVAIDQSLRKLKYDVSGFATTEARLADLQRDVQNATDEYESAQEKFSAAKTKASVIGSSLRQILKGVPSDEPEPSKRMLLTALTGIGSFILCAVGLLLIEFANFTIRSQQRLDTMTGLKSIGVLNEIETKTLDFRTIFENPKPQKDHEIFAHFLRKLRFEIQASKGQTLLITSTKAGTGKSFFIVSLSYTLSLLNKRVLIIDTNFKSSTLTKMLISKVDSRRLLNKGLPDMLYLPPASAHLNGEAHENGDADNKTKSVIHATDFKGVDIIGNYGGMDSPSEILAGKDFKSMLRNLSIEYDYILLEGAALNDYSDTKELVEYVDKVIPIFDASTTLDSLDQDSVKYLKSIKTKLVGTVLNRIKQQDLVR
jgi:uncharacterized protein involved in exopolysaccharide biosynthesis/cellulose biosynthesis protein BcsQ